MAHAHSDAGMCQHPAKAKTRGAVESVPEMPAPDGSAAALRDALDALPQKLRTVTVLHYMEGYDVSELSRLLHIPKGTVTSRLHMARGRLREILKEDIE